MCTSLFLWCCLQEEYQNQPKKSSSSKIVKSREQYPVRDYTDSDTPDRYGTTRIWACLQISLHKCELEIVFPLILRVIFGVSSVSVLDCICSVSCAFKKFTEFTAQRLVSWHVPSVRYPEKTGSGRWVRWGGSRQTRKEEGKWVQSSATCAQDSTTWLRSSCGALYVHTKGKMVPSNYPFHTFVSSFV